MKKIVCLLLSVSLLLGLCACAPGSFRYLEDAIEIEGEDKNGVKALKLGEDSYVYNKDGTLVLFRTFVSGDNTIINVNLFMDGDSIRKGEYHWEGSVYYRDEKYLIKDCIMTASTVHADDITLPLGKIYTLPEGNIIIERHVKHSISREALVLLQDLFDYLKENGSKHTAEDFGFTVFDEKANTKS